MTRPVGLPNFNNPPLMEVVLGVQFEPLENFQSVHFGDLRNLFLNDYPEVEEKPPLPPAFEIERSARPPSIQLTHRDFIYPRLWLVSENRSSLIQVQSDRFITNWRLTKNHGHYPRYEALRDGFKTHFSNFCSFVETSNIGHVRANQVEVTYVNHVPLEDSDGVELTPGDILSFLGETRSLQKNIVLETTDLSLRYSLLAGNLKWRGRLAFEVRPVLMQGGKSVLAIQLTVKGAPDASDIGAAVEFMDWARLKIVSFFAEATTDKMHNFWERTDNGSS